MVFSYGTLAHGVVAGSSGVLAIAQPALFAAVAGAVAALVGVPVPAFVASGGTPLAFAGLFLVGLGVKDVHCAVTCAKASTGLLCAESSVMFVALAAGYSLSEPFFILFAVIPAIFSAWALAEMAMAKPAKKSKD